MDKFNILYIEHDDESVGVLQTLKSIPNTLVDHIKEPSKLETILHNTHYDLIITDAFFLSQGNEHTTLGDGVYKLGEIVQKIRKCERRAIITVLTSYSPRLILEKQADLEKVDFIWIKESYPQDLLSWQVYQIIRRHRSEHLSGILVDSLINLINQAPSDNQYLWHQEMSAMLELYRSRTGEQQQIMAANYPVNMIAQKIDTNIGFHFNSMFDNLIKAESLNNAGKPKAWGHLRHSLNVFWLGYYILNAGIFNIDEIAENLYPEIAITKRREAINISWFFASMLHDVGLLGERIHDISAQLIALLKPYEFKSELIAKLSFDGNNKIFEAVSEIIISGKYLKLKDKIMQLIFNLKSIDHGILSAIVVHRAFSKSKLDPSYISEALMAILLHNLIRPKDSDYYFHEINFSDFPLVSLLLLCDQLQAWDRQTGKESIYSDIPLEYIELSEFNVIDNKLDITINYVPYRTITPTSEQMNTIRLDLMEIIQKQTLPTLAEINFPLLMEGKIKVKFLVDGRHQIGAWTS